MYILQDNVTKVSTYNSSQIEKALSIWNCENEKSSICCQNDNSIEEGNDNINGGGPSGKGRRKREAKGGSSSSGGSQSVAPDPVPSICLSFACPESEAPPGGKSNGKTKRSVNNGGVPRQAPERIIRGKSVQKYKDGSGGGISAFL